MNARLAAALACLLGAPSLPAAPAPAWDPHAYQHPAGEPVTGARIDETAVQTVLHVDAGHPQASDAGDGSAERPFATIRAAVDRGLKNKAAGVGTRILIAPGLYREAVELAPAGTDTAAPLILEGRAPGAVRVDGSDRWEDWKPAADGRTWTHPWPHDWGVMPNPWEKTDLKGTYPELVRRGEILFLEGRPVRQVLERQQLEPGTFHVSNKENTITFYPPEGTDMQTAVLEVGQRRRLVFAEGLQNVVVRKLVLQHAGGFPTGPALHFLRCSQVLAEDLIIEWNNMIPFAIGKCQHVTFRRNAASNNGYGAKIFSCDNLLVEDVTVAGNNWRGDWAGWRRWDVAGIKTLNNHGAVYRNVAALDNKCYGFWLDTNCVDNRIEGMKCIGNVSMGIYVENNQGPITIQDSIFAFNGVGVHIANSEDCVLRDCIIYDNSTMQIEILDRVDRMGEDQRTGWTGPLNAKDWTWENNVIAVSFPGIPLVSAPPYRPFFETLRSGGNLWYSPRPAQAFRIAGVPFSFAEWQEITGQDLTSAFLDPRFKDPARRDFSLPEDSPLRQRASWPKRAPVAPGIAKFDEIREEKAKASVANAYSLASAAAPSDWKPVDLAAAANRSVRGPMNFKRFRPGRQTIHGVPFVIAEAEDGEGKVIGLHCEEFPDYLDQPLPKEVQIPLGDTAAALYFLHAAAYAAKPAKLADYIITYEDGTTETIEIRNLGKASPQDASVDDLLQNSNIQDYWFNAFHLESQHAKAMMLFDRQKPEMLPTFPYTLEWINPHPEKKVREIRLAAEPGAPGAVVVLAVSALRAG